MERPTPVKPRPDDRHLRAELYAAVHTGTPGDVDFYRGVVEGSGSVLELGCGAGRVLRELAAPRRRTVGLDRDGHLLELARARTRGLNVELVQADMETFDLGERFETIVVPHGGLYCLLTPDAVVGSLACVARHLRPGGRLVFDGYAADAFHRNRRPEDVDADHLHPVTRVEARGVGYSVFERSTWCRDTQRIDATYLYVSDRGTMVEIEVRQRYLLSKEIAPLLRRAGLELHGIFGDFHRGPLRAASDVLVVHARAEGSDGREGS